MTRTEQEEIRALTTLLRMNTDPFWSRLRDLFRDRGVNPDQAVLAECFPDDTSFEFGIVVSLGGSVFQFGFDYRNRPIADGILTEWVDLTTRFQSTPYHSSIDEALLLLDDRSAG
jgi:hypothetical protein